MSSLYGKGKSWYCQACIDHTIINFVQAGSQVPVDADNVGQAWELSTGMLDAIPGWLQACGIEG